eukprot:c1547_g1_i1.p1 GENE.c1547_g1_i1~~c1547_g1_i1.p1  ORF type:complete len:201 (+),score=52.14 c1547_g1_i1:78-605(+)
MANYDMSKWPGRTYRYYAEQPLYPFGYGLSLTQFTMQCSELSGPDLAVVCNVANVGTRDGDQVVMAYHNVSADIRTAADHPIPLKALVNFARVSVAQGATAAVTLKFDATAFQVVNKAGASTLYEGVHQLTFSTGDPGVSETVLEFIVTTNAIRSTRTRHPAEPQHAFSRHLGAQ